MLRELHTALDQGQLLLHYQPKANLLTGDVDSVEDQGTLTALTERGCDLTQGYFISRPVAAPALDAWLAARAQEEARPLGQASS